MGAVTLSGYKDIGFFDKLFKNTTIMCNKCQKEEATGKVHKEFLCATCISDIVYRSRNLGVVISPDIREQFIEDIKKQPTEKKGDWQRDYAGKQLVCNCHDYGVNNYSLRKVTKPMIYCPWCGNKLKDWYSRYNEVDDKREICIECTKPLPPEVNSSVVTYIGRQRPFVCEECIGKHLRKEN